jgi:hypothetical protein
MIFFTFFLMTIDPAHHIYNIQLTKKLFSWNLLISKFSSAAPTTSTSGVACLVYCLYGAAQAVALAARAAGTPFDPCSLDLPSNSALVGFYHACLGFPVKQTWLDTIKAGNCDTFVLNNCSTTKPLQHCNGLVVEQSFSKNIIPRAQVTRLARLLPIVALSDSWFPNAYSLPRRIGYAC